MKRALILVTTLVLVLTMAGCTRSDFNQPVDITNIAQALSARGLQPCAKNELKWTAVPGFVQGMQYDVDMNCANYDPNFPAARVYLAKFDSVEARDAALRNFETINQRRIGAGFARAMGSWILVVDGNQRMVASSLVREALSDLGVQ
jgi:hypothetical protein